MLIVYLGYLRVLCIDPYQAGLNFHRIFTVLPANAFTILPVNLSGKLVKLTKKN